MRRVLLILSVAVAAIVGAYAIYWHVAANRLAEGIGRWAAERQANGYEIAYGQPVIGGFPLRLEAQIEKQNIAVEKKELTENRGKLEAIQKELDAIDARIHEQLVEGGEELQEYEELVDRLPLVQQSASYLSERVGVLKATLDQIDELKQRQSNEDDEALKALEEARKELAALR